MGELLTLQLGFSLILIYLILNGKLSHGLTCYNCGYLEDADGNKRVIVEGEAGSIPFCNGTNTADWESKEIGDVSRYSLL